MTVHNKIQTAYLTTKADYTEASNATKAIMEQYEALLDSDAKEDSEKYDREQEKCNVKFQMHDKFQAYVKAQTELLDWGFGLIRKTPSVARNLPVTVDKFQESCRWNVGFKNRAIEIMLKF